MSDSIELRITDREGNEQVIDVPLGIDLNLMEVLKGSEYDVEGTCGGMALCASCHVYINSDHQLTEANEFEEDMLDQAFFVEPNSRLSCQIRIDKKIDGLSLTLAPQ